MVTLYALCKEHDLPYTSVRRYLQSFGFETANGLTEEARIAALKEFKPAVLVQQAQETPLSPTTVLVPEGFVVTSALSPTEVLDLALPEGFDPAVMVRHFDGVMGQTVNSDQVVAIATIATSAAKKAMDEKVTAQEQALQKAQADKKKLESLIQGTVVDLKVAALKSQLLASQQNATTTDLQEMLAQLLVMGKPQDDPAAPSRSPS
jgi:hypothetical protein